MKSEVATNNMHQSIHTQLMQLHTKRFYLNSKLILSLDFSFNFSILCCQNYLGHFHQSWFLLQHKKVMLKMMLMWIPFTNIIIMPLKTMLTCSTNLTWVLILRMLAWKRKLMIFINPTFTNQQVKEGLIINPTVRSLLDCHGGWEEASYSAFSCKTILKEAILAFGTQ